EMTRNEEYYAQGRPFVNGVTVYILPDAGTSFAALRTGRVLLSTVGSRAATDAQLRIAQSELSDKLTVERYQSFTRFILIPNQEVKPWGDIRVRRAVDLAIDRQAFEKLALLGKMGGYFHPETKWGFSRQELLTQPGFRQPKDQDIAEAKKLLAEAGFASGVDAPLMCRRGEDCEIFSSALKGQLEKVGVRLTLNPTEAVTMDQKFAKGEFSVAIFPLGVLQDDPDQIIFEQYVTTGTRNHARFSDPQIDALATEQARTLDESKRRALVRKIDERLMNAHVYPSVLWLDYVRVYSKSVRGFKNGPGLWTDQNMEYAWLAK
ncbi:MAG: ABC transporter substrate-binding protein, partial [Chloroflexota bacterium]